MTARAAGRWRRWAGPSLQRRLVGALLMAFGLVWCVLIAIDFATYKQATTEHRALAQATQALADALVDAGVAAPAAGPVAQVDAAVATVRATLYITNRSRHELALEGLGDVLARLEAGDGRVLYESAALQGTTLGDTADAVIDGRRHWCEQREAGTLRLTLLEPVPPDLQVLGWMNAEQGLPMLIGLGVVLAVLLIAVRTGLAPLRGLAARLAARAPDDLQPLGDATWHAELQPLVSAFERLLARARDSLMRERALVADVAHELRTPLAVMVAQAHAVNEAPDATGRRTAQAALERATQRASHLVHQLLTLARVESGAALAVRELDLVEATRQLLVDANATAEARGVELSLDAPEALRCRIDPMLYQSIVDNLVRNAIVHGRRDGHVAVALDVDGDRLRLRVRDDGPGIAPAERATVFDRFHRGAEAGAGGAGLGLAIVRAAAEQLGGEVRLMAGLGAQGAGAGFELRWPRHAGAT